MKRKFAFLLIIILIVCLCSSYPSFADSSIKVVLNGIDIHSDAPPVIIDGRTMVPIRTISENMGYNVSWNPGLQQIDITSKINTPNNHIVVNGSDEFNQLINESLNAMDQDTRSYVTKSLRSINLEETFFHVVLGKAATTNMNTRDCYISKTFIDKNKNEFSHDDLVLIYLALITHEATHPYYYNIGLESAYTESDIEALCDLAALRAIEKAGASPSGLAYKAVKKNLSKELQY